MAWNDEDDFDQLVNRTRPASAPTVPHLLTACTTVAVSRDVLAPQRQPCDDARGDDVEHQDDDGVGARHGVRHAGRAARLIERGRASEATSDPAFVPGNPCWRTSRNSTSEAKPRTRFSTASAHTSPRLTASDVLRNRSASER